MFSKGDPRPLVGVVPGLKELCWLDLIMFLFTFTFSRSARIYLAKLVRFIRVYYYCILDSSLDKLFTSSFDWEKRARFVEYIEPDLRRLDSPERYMRLYTFPGEPALKSLGSNYRYEVCPLCYFVGNYWFCWFWHPFPTKPIDILVMLLISWTISFWGNLMPVASR